MKTEPKEIHGVFEITDDSTPPRVLGTFSFNNEEQARLLLTGLKKVANILVEGEDGDHVLNQIRELIVILSTALKV